MNQKRLFFGKISLPTVDWKPKSTRKQTLISKKSSSALKSIFQNSRELFLLNKPSSLAFQWPPKSVTSLTPK